MNVDLSVARNPAGDTTTIPENLTVWTPMTDEEVVFGPVEPSSLLVKDDASTIRDKLETLTDADRLGAEAIDFIDSAQMVYVSASGDDNADGRSPEQPVLTIAQAVTLASAFPTTSKRVIKCQDASTFTENIAPFTPLDFELPYATLTGNVSNSTAARCEMHIGALVGNITLSNGSHYNFGQVAGDIVIGNSAFAASYLRIEDYLTGTFLDTGGVGDAHIEIIHDSVGVTLNPTTTYNPYGFVADTIYTSGAGVRDALETLTADDRLDASFIKNIPAGGSQHAYAQFTDLGAGGIGWYDLITWPALTAGTVDTSGADFILFIQSGGDTVITNRINMNMVRGVPDGTSTTTFRILGLVQTGDIGGGTQYRMIRDSADTVDSIRLQIRIDPSKTYEGLMSSIIPLPYASGVVFGTPTLYTPTGTEVVVSTISTDEWSDRDIVDGTSGGIACSSIGEHGPNTAYIDFSTNSQVDIHADDVIIGKYASHGTRMSAGEYGTWIANNKTDWPIDTNYWTDLVADKRPEVDDTSLNPASTITMNGADTGGSVRELMPIVSGGTHFGIRYNTAGSGGTQITFRDCLFQRIKIYLRFGISTSSGGTTQDFELVDSTGTQVAELTIPAANNNVGDTYEFEYEFATGAGDTVLTLRKRSTGTNQAVYLYDYDMHVIINEPDLEKNVVVQQDSPLRGTLLPRIIPQNTGHPTGSLALNGLADNRPIWYDGSDWSYVTTTRIASGEPVGQFFFAEGNTLADSGWTGSNNVRWVNTENHAGFPEVIRCTQTGGTITLQAPNNTQAFWDTCRANGFRTDLRAMFGAAHDGQIWVDIEPNNTSWGSNGRFEYNVTVSSGQLQITMINSGGNTTFDLERDTMYLISMINSPGEDTCDIHVDGVKVGEVTYAGGGTTDRGTFFYTPPGNAVNDMSIQSITTYTIAAASTDVTMDRQSIRTGLRYNIPNVNAPVTVRIPKGLYDFGNTFTIVNGSSEVATVSGEVGDNQLFGGTPSLQVFPQKEMTFTQTASPRGNVWAVEGGKTVINHNENTSTGNALHMTLSNTGAIDGRHGNFTDAVAVTRVQAGQYSIAPAGPVLDDSTTVIATARSATGAVRSCNYTITLGEVFVDVKDAAGTLTDDAVSVSMYW
jgi:hypothetical protein